MVESAASVECRKIIAQHSKSFSLASRLLPMEVRDDAVAVYAWCRRCDDAIDHAPIDKLNDVLNSLNAEADAIFSGESLPDVVAAAFQEVAVRRRIPRLYVDELLMGMSMDAVGLWAPTREEFLRYCHRVAGVVGLMMCHVLGVADARALPHAVHLGMAMQMTNIARDVAEDWERGRLYLPQFMLNDAGIEVAPGAELTPEVALRLSLVVARLLRWADRYYESGRLGLKSLDPRSSWAIDTAASVYRSIGNRIAAQDFNVLRGRAVVSKQRKISFATLSLGKTLIRSATTFRWRTKRFPVPADILTFEEVPVLGIPH
jgi:15-cis-phytoene synthase